MDYKKYDYYWRNMRFLSTIFLFVLLNPLAYSWGGYLGVNQGTGSVNASVSTNDVKTASKMSYVAGVFESFDLGVNTVFFRPAIQYAPREFKITTSPARTYSYTNLEVPLLFKLDLPYPFLPNFIIGPNLGFLISKSCKSNTSSITSCTLPATPSFNYGIDVGLSAAPHHNVFLELRYYIGLTDIDSTATYKSYHREYMFLVGFLL